MAGVPKPLPVRRCSQSEISTRLRFSHFSEGAFSGCAEGHSRGLDGGEDGDSFIFQADVKRDAYQDDRDQEITVCANPNWRRLPCSSRLSNQETTRENEQAPM